MSRTRRGSLPDAGTRGWRSGLTLRERMDPAQSIVEVSLGETVTDKGSLPLASQRVEGPSVNSNQLWGRPASQISRSGKPPGCPPLPQLATPLSSDHGSAGPAGRSSVTSRPVPRPLLGHRSLDSISEPQKGRAVRGSLSKLPQRSAHPSCPNSVKRLGSAHPVPQAERRAPVMASSGVCWTREEPAGLWNCVGVGIADPPTHAHLLILEGEDGRQKAGRRLA